MNIDTQQSLAGYYEVSIASPFYTTLLATNTERAFIIAQLQELLSTRSLLEEPDAHRRLASHIDLLAFSLLPKSMRFVLFSISPQSVSLFTKLLLQKLSYFKNDLHYAKQLIAQNSLEPIVTMHRLVGPHEALALSIEIHLDHPDWEFDRYSSIGFFIHDRRGDWMRLWRLTHLYENTPNNYRRLLSTRH